MLHTITTPQHAMFRYLTDDPVRPEIPTEFRVAQGRFVLALAKDEQPEAIVCVSLHNTIPHSVQDLSATADVPSVCVAYSIWSYSPGAGRDLLMNMIQYITKQYPTITRIVTLSPKTIMARKFHLKNGAFVLQENDTTVNYEYPNISRS